MQVIIRTLTWTFIHSLWLGLVAALFAAVIISCTRKSTARLRYNLLTLVMFLFIAATVITFRLQWRAETNLLAERAFAISDDVSIITIGLKEDFTNWVNANSEIVILAWTFFFLLSCLRLVTGLAAIDRLRHYKTHPVSIEWKNKLEQLQVLLGVRHSVSILQSELIKVPMALGILKPVIFLPLGLLAQLPPEQVETILLHELAHIRRRDYLVNLLQHIAEAIFFFNPAVRWLSSLIRQEREACCDDLVIASCNQATNYFNALINFQEYSIDKSFAMGIVCRRHYLFNRIERMITKKNRGINVFEKIALLSGIVLLSAFNFVNNQKQIKTANRPEPASLPVAAGKPEFQTIKTKAKKTSFFNKAVTDSIPAKKRKQSNDVINNNNKPVPKLTESQKAVADADAALQDIIQLKNQIGVKKENIGLMKQQLNTTEGQEKEKIQNQIDQERQEIIDKRRQLDLKRTEWDRLKKIAREKQQENTSGKTFEYENSGEWDISNTTKQVSTDFNAVHVKVDFNNIKKIIQNSENLQAKNPPRGATKAFEIFKKPEAPPAKIRQL